MTCTTRAASPAGGWRGAGAPVGAGVSGVAGGGVVVGAGVRGVGGSGVAACVAVVGGSTRGVAVRRGFAVVAGVAEEIDAGAGVAVAADAGAAETVPAVASGVANSKRVARTVTVSTGASGSSAPHAAATRTAPRKTPTMHQNLLVRGVTGRSMHV